jgi:hypothetical protein
VTRLPNSLDFLESFPGAGLHDVFLWVVLLWIACQRRVYLKKVLGASTCDVLSRKLSWRVLKTMGSLKHLSRLWKFLESYLARVSLKLI